MVRAKPRKERANRPPAVELDPFTRGFVRKIARQFAGKFGFARQDRDEIEQRLYLKLAGQLPKARPDDPAWKAFVATSVRRAILNMIRDSKAEKRDHRRVSSLHAPICNQHGSTELAATIGEHESPSQRGRIKRSDYELTELLSDVNECLTDIADDQLREFCQRLKHDCVAQVARDMDIPRTTLNYWLSTLRRRFEDRGLREYL
jgi:DNA-directed RNA polymerase specialized sigma24 family protein